MKHFILITLLLATTSSYNLTAQKISSEDYKKNYIHEEFNGGNEVFKVETTTENYFILDKGDYLLSRNNVESEYAIIANNSIVSDFVLKTEIRIGPSENKKASIGIILKAQKDGKGAIIFEINKQREYRIKQLIGSAYQTLSGNSKKEGWVKNNLVNGADEHNFIEIRSEKNTYDIYINKTFLTTFSVSDFTTGACGLIISPETKARISYYYINIKGEKNLVANWDTDRVKNVITNDSKLKELNKEIKNLNANIEESNKKIKILEEKNTKLSKLNNATEELNKTIRQLETENKNISKLHKINVKHQNNLEQKSQQIAKLNQMVNSKKNEISNLNNKNIDLVSTSINQEKQINTLQNSVKNLRVAENEASKNNKQLNKNKEQLEKQIKVQKSANTKLISKLSKSNKELNTLKTTQAKYDDVTSNLNDDIKNMNGRISQLINTLDTENLKNTALQLSNNELKELFILKDFEINGVKPSEMAKETSNTAAAPKVLIGNKTIYSVQFGVYMQEQPYSSIKDIDNAWYNTTEQGTYVYYSGEFNLPQEAASHMNNLISIGYVNALIVTLTR